MIGNIICFFIGANVSLFLYALIFTAKKADTHIDKEEVNGE